jgi:hypothetical protein
LSISASSIVSAAWKAQRRHQMKVRC